MKLKSKIVFSFNKFIWWINDIYRNIKFRIQFTFGKLSISKEECTFIRFLLMEKSQEYYEESIKCHDFEHSVRLKEDWNTCIEIKRKLLTIETKTY